VEETPCARVRLTPEASVDMIDQHHRGIPFQTSVAVVGQLAEATAITWAITAPLAGPVAAAYGRRRLLLMAGGLLGSVLAWNYGSLLACRLFTGVGVALIPPNAIALIADAVPPEARGTAIGWLISTSGVGAVVRG